MTVNTANKDVNALKGMKALKGTDGVNHSQPMPSGRVDSIGSILEICDASVDFESFRKVLDLERVTVNTANKDVKALKGTDGVNHSQSMPSGRFDSIGSTLEICDASVDFESFRKVLCTLWPHSVVVQTVKGRTHVRFNTSGVLTV